MNHLHLNAVDKNIVTFESLKRFVIPSLFKIRSKADGWKRGKSNGSHLNTHTHSKTGSVELLRICLLRFQHQLQAHSFRSNLTKSLFEYLFRSFFFICTFFRTLFFFSFLIAAPKIPNTCLFSLYTVQFWKSIKITHWRDWTNTVYVWFGLMNGLGNEATISWSICFCCWCRRQSVELQSIDLKWRLFVWKRCKFWACA